MNTVRKFYKYLESRVQRSAWQEKINIQYGEDRSDIWDLVVVYISAREVQDKEIMDLAIKCASKVYDVDLEAHVSRYCPDANE